MAGLKCRSNIITHSSAILACQRDEWTSALQILECLGQLRMAPNLFCYNSAVTSCGKAPLVFMMIHDFQAQPVCRLLKLLMRRCGTRQFALRACSKKVWQLTLWLEPAQYAFTVTSETITQL